MVSAEGGGMGVPLPEVWAEVPMILRGEAAGFDRSTVYVTTGETAMVKLGAFTRCWRQRVGRRRAQGRRGCRCRPEAALLMYLGQRRERVVLEEAKGWQGEDDAERLSSLKLHGMMVDAAGTVSQVVGAARYPTTQICGASTCSRPGKAYRLSGTSIPRDSHVLHCS